MKYSFIEKLRQWSYSVKILETTIKNALQVMLGSVIILVLS